MRVTGYCGRGSPGPDHCASAYEAQSPKARSSRNLQPSQRNSRRPCPRPSPRSLRVIVRTRRWPQSPQLPPSRPRRDSTASRSRPSLQPRPVRKASIQPTPPSHPRRRSTASRHRYTLRQPPIQPTPPSHPRRSSLQHRSFRQPPIQTTPLNSSRRRSTPSPHRQPPQPRPSSRLPKSPNQSQPRRQSI